MAFLKKHPVEVATLLLVGIGLALYLFLVRPVMIKRQTVSQATEEKIAQLRRYRKEPPSQKMIVELSREKKNLGEQYKKVIKTLHFARPVPVQKVTGPRALYFEQQLEEAGNNLGTLAETSGMKIPDRLGFGKEKPQSKEELSLLLSQLDAAKKLVALVIKSGVSSLSVLNPLPLPSPGVANIPQQGVAPGPSPGIATSSSGGDEFGQGSNKSSFKELQFDLQVRAKISALTKLLYELENYSFTVTNLEIKSVSGGEREIPSVSQGQIGRRRRRVLYGSPLNRYGSPLPGNRLKEKEKTVAPVELEAKLLVSTRLLPSKQK